MSKASLSPAIQAALSELRWRIRAYVLVEGLALAAVWIGLTFWLGLALDYLPVLTWASEMPRGVRAILLAVVAGVLAWILYNYILRRLFVRLKDRSMALLVERKFKGFSDELVTAVEMSDGAKGEAEGADDGIFDEEMLERTKRIADNQVRRLRLADIFNPAPLQRNIVMAALLLLPIIPFALLQPDALKTWVQRFYMLSDVTWPRDTLVQVVGFQPQRAASAQDSDGKVQMRSFGSAQMLKIAKGGSGELRVRAKSRSGKEAPQYCTVYYRAADGARSSVRMNRVGRISRDGYQEYALASKPFKGVLENLQFDVVANDSRLNGYELNVVDSPLIGEVTLDCEFPEYLVDVETSSWLPRQMKYVPNNTSLPIGTQVTLNLLSNKPLKSATIQVGEGAPVPTSLKSDTNLEYVIPKLEATTTLFISVTDQDGVVMERPQKFVIGAVKDNPPELDVRHRGISSMVTADVRIPIEGTAKDDHRIDRAWFELVTPDGVIHEYEDVKVDKEGGLTGGLDLRAKRAIEKKDEALKLETGMKLTITAMAADRFNLSDEKNIGTGVRMDLEVVTPETLLTLLDQRELTQRKIFEHVIEEMSAMRDDLARVEKDLSDGKDPVVEPGENVTVEQLKQRVAALRLLRIQQAGLQSEKSSQETAAVAATFEDIVLELQNNRVDSNDRQERLVQKIAAPLKRIAETLFPVLDERLEVLETALNEKSDNQVSAAAEALDQADLVLAEMNKVLQEIETIETMNELIELLRLIREEQLVLKRETEKERAKDARSILE